MVIKGVNRQIIEVTDTGNEYFERALLVVRPNCVDAEAVRLREEAQRMLRNAGGYAGLRNQRRRRIIRRTAYGLGAGTAGALVGGALAFLLR